jgi:hypothetical protein
MSRDIGRLLAGFDYLPGEVIARRVTTADGRPAVQLRLDLGLMQMQLEGRPDGVRPHGDESLLTYHSRRRDEHRLAHGGDDEGFALDPDDCRDLRNEALLYYYRYISLCKLEDWAGVERDTARNLACLDFLHRYARREPDKFVLEQYRPYLTMMHARARARRALEADDFDGAAAEVQDGLRRIRNFFSRYGKPELFERSPEADLLERLLEEIEARRPKPAVLRLREQLSRAVADEDYERAADLRDRLRRLEGSAGGPAPQ